MMRGVDPTDQSPPAATNPALTVEEWTARVEALEKERDEALGERDAARREAEGTERRVVAALAGELVGLARRARSEYAERLARGEGARFEQLIHHAKAFEYVAVELAGKFGGEVAEAIVPPAAPEQAPEQAEGSSQEAQSESDERAAPVVSRRNLIEID